MAEPKLAEVKQLDFKSQGCIEVLEEMLEKAKRGEIRAVALVFEETDGRGGWRAGLGTWSRSVALIGRLYVLAQQLTLNEVLEWKPDR